MSAPSRDRRAVATELLEAVHAEAEAYRNATTEAEREAAHKRYYAALDPFNAFVLQGKIPANASDGAKRL